MEKMDLQRVVGPAAANLNVEPGSLNRHAARNVTNHSFYDLNAYARSHRWLFYHFISGLNVYLVNIPALFSIF